MINKPTIICLTPVKNEDWIIEKFLRATSLWAEYIILADQNSTDRTVEIAEKFKNEHVAAHVKLKKGERSYLSAIAAKII